MNTSDVSLYNYILIYYLWSLLSFLGAEWCLLFALHKYIDIKYTGACPCLAGSACYE